jgi:hypothetical protein
VALHWILFECKDAPVKLRSGFRFVSPSRQ